MEESKLDLIINSVVDTLKFHGVTIDNIELSPRGIPRISVSISKSKRYKSLDDTLDLVYWTMWILLYGKYDESKEELKINLDYIEVD